MPGRLLISTSTDGTNCTQVASGTWAGNQTLTVAEWPALAIGFVRHSGKAADVEHGGTANRTNCSGKGLEGLYTATKAGRADAMKSAAAAVPGWFTAMPCRSYGTYGACPFRPSDRGRECFPRGLVQCGPSCVRRRAERLRSQSRWGHDEMGFDLGGDDLSCGLQVYGVWRFGSVEALGADSAVRAVIG